MQGPMAARRSRGKDAELAPHLANTFFHNPRHRSSPAGMKRADNAALGIGHQDGNAVSGLDRQKQAGSVGDEAVAGERLVGGRAHAMHD